MKHVLIGTALAALVPTLLGSSFYINLGTQILIAAIFASSYNIIAGWGGLISFGHAAFFGAAGYGAALAVLKGGFGHLAAALLGIAFATVLAGVVGALALRATGISFLMITLALGQILWGLSYRWVSVTGGDNGLTGLARPKLFGLSLDGAGAYYYFTLAVAVVAFLSIRQFAGSSLGASLRGSRDQPRRMSALGFNIWLTRWLAFVYAGFWAGVAGLLFLYYHRFIGPHSLSIAESAEVLLMVILGGAGTLSGPIVGAAIIVLVRNLVSGYVEHWPMLLGALFLLVIMFVPEGLVPGLAARLRRASRASGRKAPIEAPPRVSEIRLRLSAVSKSFGGVQVVRDVDLAVAPGERRLILGPNGAGKTTLFNLITGDVACDHGSIVLNDAELSRLPTARRVRAGLARTYQILSLFPHDSLRQNVVLALLGLSRSRWNPFDVLAERQDLRGEADRILATVHLDGIADRAVAQCTYGEKRRLEIALALAQRPQVLLLDEPLAGLSQAERTDTQRLLASIPPSVTVLLIEHDMDIALTLAERVTVLHLGEVIADGDRDAVIRDPRVREVYLGE